MKHRLRKYLGNRGSALFMVLSTMSALMVLVMAMYFSIVSSRAVQYKVFNQEQAYRSSISVSETIIAALDKGGTLATTQPGASTSLIDAMVKMNVGESINTDTNGFKAFGSTDPAALEEIDQLGAYTVNITRLNDEVDGINKKMIFDVAITTSINGVIETTHSYMSILLKNEEPVSTKSSLFTSTGYVPNDVYLDGGCFYTDVFFDNENAIIGAYKSMQNKVYGNISAGGSLSVNYLEDVTHDKPTTWAIRNNFTQNSNTVIGLGSSTERGTMYVGGDAVFTTTGLVTNADIYVLGDLYMYSNAPFSNITLHVNGNIYISQDNLIPTDTCCNGTVVNTSTGASRTITKWNHDDGEEGTHHISVSDMADRLDEKTQSQTFFNWEINDNDPSEVDDYIAELDKESAFYNPVTLEFNNNSEAHGTVPGMTLTQYLNWGPAPNSPLPNYYGTGKELNYTACVIKDVKNDSHSNHANNLTIIIDTGDDPNNQYIIKVEANRDIDGDGTKESFSWYPYEAHNSAVEMAVIVRGCGSVVIDVPEGVIYQDMDNVTFMHETWFAILGGKYEVKNTNVDAHGNPTGIIYDARTGILSGSTAVNTNDFIHSCDEHCTACTYTISDGDECSVCDNGTEYKEVYCENHEYTYKYCPAHEANLEPNKRADGSYYGICKNRIDRTKVDAAVAALATSNPALYQRLKDSCNDPTPAPDTKEWYYPNNNIFLVSCEESADIRLSTMLDGTTIMQNCFFGFIYAPYMTFKAYGNNAGGGYVRFCGGMVVSDYVIQDSMSIMTCYPDQLPENLMSGNCGGDALKSLSSKSWKISLDSY